MEKTLSTRWFKTYRIGIIVLFALFLGVQAFYYLEQAVFKNWMFSIFIAIYIGVWPLYVVKKMNPFFKNFRQVKYSEDTLYVAQSGNEEIIPFYDIKDVEIKSLDGIYCFELRNGTKYFCKPSIWYPFDFRKVDEELDRIRRNIKLAKQRFWSETQNSNTLTSQNFS